MATNRATKTEVKTETVKVKVKKNGKEYIKEVTLNVGIKDELIKAKEEAEKKEKGSANATFLRAFLVLKGIKDSTEQKGYLEALGFKGAKTNFAKVYYDFLAEKERSFDEAKGFILGSEGYEETSENVRNHLNHYLNIFRLVKEVRDNLK